MIGVGVIGYGYWGPNLVRNFMEVSGATVIAVSDIRPERLLPLKARYPTIKLTDDYKELLADPAIDAVAIATPVGTHYPLALDVLRSGRHLLVEKPFTSMAAHAEQLIDEAARRRLTLLVDHTFVYTAAVRKIRELIDAGELGTLYYYDSTRVNLGLFQHDVNVLWDLVVHDLAILDHVLPLRPVAVSATGMGHLPGQPEDVAYMTLFFPDRLIAHLNANWLAPAKIRKTLIGGSQKMIVYDDLEPSEKIKVYDKGVTVSQRPEAVYELLVSYRSGDMWAPKLDLVEALRTEALHFVDCIVHGTRPLTDGEAGLRVVRMLEAAEASLRERGRLMDLDGAGAS